MIPQTNKRFFTSPLTLTFELIIFIFFSSFTGFNTWQSTFNPEQKKNYYSIEFIPEKSSFADYNESSFPVWRYNKSNQNSIQVTVLPDEPNLSTNLPNDSNSASPYFPKIYYGNGVDHMNINLVNLNQTGLKVDDEIGVFDGIYCVGSAVIELNNMEENNLSIPSSANDTIESNPNGFIPGHKITLKAYRTGTIYQLLFQTVNDSQDTFERGGSMFGLIDFLQSTELSAIELSKGIRIFPNPFNGSLTIEITLPHPQNLNCEIIDLNGQLVSTLFNGEAEQHISLIWDGADNNKKQVPSGMYVCQVNQTSIRVLYNKLDDQ